MTKLQKAKDLLKSIESTEVLVAFSGGKDSIVTLDLCCEMFERVEAFYMYIVKDLNFVNSFLDPLAEKYEIKLHRVPHYILCQAYKLGLYTINYSFQESELRLSDVETYIKAKTGIEWIANGARKADSIERLAMLSNNGGIDRNTHKVYPIAEWKAEDVRSYLRLRNLPLPENQGKKMSGVDLCPETLCWIQENHPSDFEKIKNIFPFVEAPVKRKEFLLKRGESVPVPVDPPAKKKRGKKSLDKTNTRVEDKTLA